MKGTWKEAAHRCIAKVIAANPGKDEQELRKLISAAYPWGERCNHPYKAWLSAVRETFAQPKTHGIDIPKAYNPTDYTDTPLFVEVPAR